MSDFHVGQEVVCVDSDNATRYSHRKYRPLEPGEVFPQTGAHYTIRELVDDEGIAALRLVEITNPTRNYIWDDRSVRLWENAFNIRRFRPIKSETIEVFREMCRAVSKRTNA